MSNCTTNGYAVCDCEKCPKLVENRNQIVNGVGPADADILFVGEAPGENEDKNGEPFVGRSGEKLDDALEQAGTSREDVRITNIVRCRPPENRDPTKQERENCHEFLISEIIAIDPEVIIPIGKIPSEELVDESVAITKQAGEQKTIEVGNVDYPVILCPHPAAMFYNRDLEPVFYDTIAEAVATAKN